MNNTTQNKLADVFAKRFEEYNEKVLRELAKTINKFNGLSFEEANKLANELRYDISYIDLVNELSKLTGKSKKEIKKVLEETIKQHTEFADTFFKARGMNTPIYEKDRYLQDLVQSVANVSEGDFTNIARSTGFAFTNKEGHIEFLNMQQTYYKVIDECIYGVVEGKETYQQSMRRLIKQLSDSGVRRIVYANDGSQYTQRIDSAIRRNLLDSIRQVSIETQKEFGKRFGADGVEVTVHSNPAPDHMNVQGHQFSTKRPSENELSEWEKFQNDEDCVDVNGVEFPAISEETGRDRRSIGEYNCYHTIFSIIVGVSSPLYSDKELQEIKDKAIEKIKIDGKEYTRYEATQLQRKLETEIRYSKDRHIMYKETNDREGMLEEQKKIKDLTKKYKEISQKADIREQLNRASVSGYKPIKVKEVENIKVSNSPQRKKDIAIHFGDLGKGRDTYYTNISGDRSTGHFGTGTYFLSKEEAKNMKNNAYFSREERPEKEIDFSEYKLYKPRTENEGFVLHDGLKAINSKTIFEEKEIENIRTAFNKFNRDYEEKDLLDKLDKFGYNIEEIKQDYESGLSGRAEENLIELTEDIIDDYDRDVRDYNRMTDILLQTTDLSKQEIDNAFEEARKKLLEYNELGYKYGQYPTIKVDSLSTIFMKELGYNGIDVRDFELLDNTKYGSVIYDLKKKKNRK